MLYDDGLIACDDEGLTIRRYFAWGGAKRIPYSAIRSVNRFEMTALGGRWRIWGSGDFRHWWNLDSGRPGKSGAFVLDLGRHWLPTISPDDPEAVAEILSRHVGHPS